MEGKEKYKFGFEINPKTGRLLAREKSIDECREEKRKKQRAAYHRKYRKKLKRKEIQRRKKLRKKLGKGGIKRIYDDPMVNLAKLPHTYHLLHISNARKVNTLYHSYSEEKVYDKFFELLKRNKEEVAFPRMFNSTHSDGLLPSDHELVILKKREKDEDTVTKVKNDFGEATSYEVIGGEYIVIERAPYYVEEQFWVYGYHPSIQRKDFYWIFENFIQKDIHNKMVFKMVIVYLNKLLIDIDGNLNVVFCKNKSDCARLYNTLQEWCAKKKYKHIAFMGSVKKSNASIYWRDKLIELTHWDKRKLVINCTKKRRLKKEKES